MTQIAHIDLNSTEQVFLSENLQKKLVALKGYYSGKSDLQNVLPILSDIYITTLPALCEESNLRLAIHATFDTQSFILIVDGFITHFGRFDHVTKTMNTSVIIQQTEKSKLIFEGILGKF